MTVKELIAKLEQLPQHVTVVVDLHSEYCEVTDASTIELTEKGGYLSHPYSEEDKLRVRTCVRVD